MTKHANFFDDNLRRIMLGCAAKLKRHFGIKPHPDNVIPEFIGFDMGMYCDTTQCVMFCVERGRLYILDSFQFPQFFFPRALPIELKGIAV